MKYTKTLTVLAGSLMAVAAASPAHAGNADVPANGGKRPMSVLSTPVGDASPTAAGLVGAAGTGMEAAGSLDPARDLQVTRERPSLVKGQPRSTGFSLGGVPLGVDRND